MIKRELSHDEITQRSAKLASEELEREKLLEMKRSHNREWNEQLKQAHERIGVLAAEVDSGQAWVPAQSDMFDADSGEVDEAPPPRRRGRRAAAEAGDTA
jgi:hypothetical protein